MGFWSELKRTVKEGWEEGKAEGEAESKAVEEKFAAKEAARQAATDAEKQRILGEIAKIPFEEKFAMCLAAPFRVTLFYDWYDIFKEDDYEQDKYPLHLYTFGDDVDVTPKDIKNIRQYIKRDFSVTNREQAIYHTKRLLAEAGIPVRSELFRPTSQEVEEGFEPTRFTGFLHDPALADLEKNDRVLFVSSTRVLLSSMIALLLTSSADVGYITKDEAMDALADVNYFVRSLIPGTDAGWPEFAILFLAGEGFAKMNNDKGRGILEKFVGYLKSKPGSPWNNVLFHIEGEELLSEHALQYGAAALLYSEEEIDAVDAHISKYFGEYENVFHEIASPDIHLEIVIIEPTPERPVRRLVTLGAGACPMNVPEELSGRELERMELVTVLPADWDIDSDDEKDYWPIGTLKDMARYPLENDTWLGWGHTVQLGVSFPGASFVGYILLMPRGVADGGEVCTLPDGSEVNFYQLVPLYEDEMKFKIEHGTDALLEKLYEAFGHDWLGVIDVGRRNVVK